MASSAPPSSFESFELRPQSLRASDFGVELPSPAQIFDDGSPHVRRQYVLLETLGALEQASATARYHELALRNLQRWAQQARSSPPAGETAAGGACAVLILPGDWGEVTLELTRRYGTLFASLNMANAYGPGGGYVELDGERHVIRAGIETLGGYSAHADQAGLVDFVTGMARWPEQVRIVHGEPHARRALAAALKHRYQQKGRPLRTTPA